MTTKYPTTIVAELNGRFSVEIEEDVRLVWWKVGDRWIVNVEAPAFDDLTVRHMVVERPAVH